MSIHETPVGRPQRQPDAPDRLAKRDVRALTRSMVVDEYDADLWSDREVVVYSGETSRYVVNPYAFDCGCGDWVHRKPEGGCQHIRRARYALGLDDVPAWVRRDRVDPTLRRALEANDGVDRGDGLATDGGEVVEALESFDDLSYGDTIDYVGPDEFESPWASPGRPLSGTPWTFEFVTVGGSLSCLTRFNSPKRLEPEHPANDPAHWVRVEGDR